MGVGQLLGQLQSNLVALIFVIKHLPQSSLFYGKSPVSTFLDLCSIFHYLHYTEWDIECKERIQLFHWSTNRFSIENIYYCYNSLFKYVCKRRNYYVVFMSPSWTGKLCFSLTYTPLLIHLAAYIIFNRKLVWRNIREFIWLS